MHSWRMDVHLSLMFMFTFLISVEGTQPPISLRGGHEGIVPCRVQGEPFAVGWYKASSDLERTFLVFMEASVRGGIGFEQGSFNITDDFALVINEVRVQDEGLYFCDVFYSLTEPPLSIPQNISVFVLPEEPYPSLDFCLDHAVYKRGGTNCSLYGVTHFYNLTCFVDSYYPGVTLYFQLDSQKIEPVQISTWTNDDSTIGKRIMISAAPSFYPYGCIAHVDGQSSVEAASILIRQRPLLSSGEHNLSKGAAMGIIVVLFITSVLLPGILFAVIRRRQNQAVKLPLDEDHLNVENELQLYWLDTFTLPKLLSIDFKAPTSYGPEARKAARLIFGRKTLETLRLLCDGPLSEQFCKEMERNSRCSGIKNIEHFWVTLNSVAAGCYARALCKMPNLRLWSLQNAELSDDFYTEMAKMSPSWQVKKIYYKKNCLHRYHLTIIAHLPMLRYLMLIDINIRQHNGTGGPIEQLHQHQPHHHHQRMDDSKELVTGRPYNWKDWCLVRGGNFLYIWSDAVVLELTYGSNGWFDFILDGKLETMYPDGDIIYTSTNLGDFPGELQQARSQVLPGVQTQPILSIPGPTKLAFGNWTLQCEKKGEMVIHHSHNQQAAFLREELTGFIFESTRGTKHSFIAKTSLGPEFSTGWTDKWGRRFFSRQEHVQEVGLYSCR